MVVSSPKFRTHLLPGRRLLMSTFSSCLTMELPSTLRVPQVIYALPLTLLMVRTELLHTHIFPRPEAQPEAICTLTVLKTGPAIPAASTLAWLHCMKLGIL